jgi:hypothetical protein
MYLIQHLDENNDLLLGIIAVSKVKAGVHYGHIFMMHRLHIEQ